MKKNISLLLTVVLVLVSLSINDTAVVAAKKVSKIKLNKKSITLTIGDSCKIKANVKAKWKSSNNKIASVNQKGVVTAKKKGNANISASVKGKKAICKVKVVSEKKAGKKNITTQTSDKHLVTATKTPITKPLFAALITKAPEKTPEPDKSSCNDELGVTSTPSPYSYLSKNDLIKLISESSLNKELTNGIDSNSELRYEFYIPGKELPWTNEYYSIEKQSFSVNYIYNGEIYHLTWEFFGDAKSKLENDIKQMKLYEIVPGSGIYCTWDGIKEEVQMDLAYRYSVSARWIQDGYLFACNVPFKAVKEDKSFLVDFCNLKKVFIVPFL